MKHNPLAHLSIRAKLIIAFMLLVLVPLSIGGTYGVYYSIKALEDSTLHYLEYEVSSKASDIEKFLKTVHNDVIYLSQSSGIKGFVDNRKAQSLKGSEGGIITLKEEYLAFSRTRPYYYQIRYIDEAGYEVIRVDSDEKSSVLMSTEKLQFKGDRYYFTEAMKYEKGQCYVSPMDLNIEWGKVEIPHKPVVRVATPVFDSTGKKRGIVIINIFASYLIQQMQMMNIVRGGSTYLVNKDGFYLSRLNSEATDQEFILGSTDGLGNDYSKEIVTRILSGKHGTVKDESRILSYAPIHTGDTILKDYWILVLEYPKVAIFASVSRLEFVYFVIGVISVLSSFVVGIWMARRLTRPILELHKGVEWIAHGDFDHRLSVRTGDEIESLSERFNNMVDALKDYREKMLKWNEELKTEVDKRTRELEFLHNEQQQMEKQLHQADKMASIGELSTGIAHEIGNPLAAIKTVIQAMEEDCPLKGQQRKYLTRILKEVDRLTAFIRTFSTFAHPSAKQPAICRVDMVLKDVLFLVGKEAIKQRITIDEVIDNDIPDVWIDPQQMQQILINLLLNAIQSMPQGGKIRIMAGYNGLSDKDFVNVSISDTGCGIPEQQIDKIFNPFFTTKATGTGLGLSIVHRIINEYNGKIIVSSIVGEGTTFHISLPLLSYISKIDSCKEASINSI
ncbi:MAG: HAMP domain-containing protein [Deltaproteobacteria bacterium]|nr:HAMP domain-containing protein [Deltaproteobacteria bacterium]